MGWTPLKRSPLSAGSVGKLPVSLSATAGSGRSRPRLILVTRPSLLDGADWIKAGTGCNVMLGNGEHAGMLRVEAAANGDYYWHVPGGRKARISLMLFLPWPEGVRPSKHDTNLVEYDYSDSWLEITLPAYARPPSAGTVAARDAALAKMASPTKAARP